MIHWLYETFVPSGDGVIGGACVSIVLLVAPAVRAWRKHLRPHLQRTREIHQHLNENHPFTIRHDVDH